MPASGAGTMLQGPAGAKVAALGGDQKPEPRTGTAETERPTLVPGQPVDPVPNLRSPDLPHRKKSLEQGQKRDEGE